MRSLFCLLLTLTLSAAAEASISWDPNGPGGATTAPDGKYTGCAVTKVAVGNSVTWVITCESPGGTPGVLTISNDDTSLDDEEKRALEACVSQNDSNNEVSVSSTGMVVARVATGPTS